MPTDDDRQLRVDAWEALLHAHAAIVPRIAADLEAATGLPLTWYDVLLELYRAHDNKLRMQDLGERVVLSRSRVSRIVDELAAAGHVDKQPDPCDGRGTLAVLTAEGRGIFRRAAPIHLDLIERYVGCLTKTQAKAIRSGLNHVTEGAEAAAPAPTV